MSRIDHIYCSARLHEERLLLFNLLSANRALVDKMLAFSTQGEVRTRIQNNAFIGRLTNYALLRSLVMELHFFELATQTGVLSLHFEESLLLLIGLVIARLCFFVHLKHICLLVSTFHVCKSPFREPSFRFREASVSFLDERRRRRHGVTK